MIDVDARERASWRPLRRCRWCVSPRRCPGVRPRGRCHRRGERPRLSQRGDGRVCGARGGDLGASCRAAGAVARDREAAAGYECASVVTPGTAVRIMTGAPVPAGADAVVRFEETDEERGVRHGPGDTVAIMTSVRPGENVRPIGEDVHAGETVLWRNARASRGNRRPGHAQSHAGHRPPPAAGDPRRATRSSMPASHWTRTNPQQQRADACRPGDPLWR